jgi:hypothetical protein
MSPPLLPTTTTTTTILYDTTTLYLYDTHAREMMKDKTVAEGSLMFPTKKRKEGGKFNNNTQQVPTMQRDTESETRVHVAA